MTSLKKIFYLSVLAILFIACVSEEQGQSKVEEEVPTSEGISISPKQFESSGFELGKLEKRSFMNYLAVNGKTHLPEKNKAAVSSYVGGSVGGMELIHGQWVKKGQVLFTITNPELINWQQDFLVLQSEVEYQESEYDRQKILTDENIAAKKNLPEAKSRVSVTKAKLAGLSKKLSLIGINTEELTNTNLVSTLRIAAPSSGYVTEINIKKGMYLEAFQTAIEISNTNHIHMELKVLEKNISMIKNGQKVRYSLQENPSEQYVATIYLIEKRVDENRMVNVHCHLEEEQEKALIPGMFITADIELESQESYAVPEGALVSFNDNYYILEHKPDTKYDFTQKLVDVGQNQNGFYQINESAEVDTIATYLTKGAYYVVTSE